ncbi:helix-turn-helix transcriptional regulator [Aurantiacibacter sp. D1-12]|uniref:helix-turn-helix transcriptional regulator n=1 Tax=Aurantiacibacter sp. D1-12 TaxID=2993658 RepID=UPI00237C7876|nr:helix-turn-helix domain-containing protein [Aurantiacibacter sp. D1-12]MDE1467494.1 helix-turn-helix domain-containing protein [Aurantiacibacter sp. D1-12]
MSPPRTPSLNNQLRQFRVEAGLTQQELAEKVGVTRKTINTVENAVFIPSTVLALKLAAALGTDVHSLFQLPDASK